MKESTLPVLPRPATAGPRAATESGSILTGLNLLCLDAPLVALSWQWLFARSFHLRIAPGGTAALFLTAWLIYLADRFGDSLATRRDTALSLRQRFCLEHRGLWLSAILLVALAIVYLASTHLERGTLRAGFVVGACALLYLSFNQLTPALWRVLPLKEVCIGLLFAAGVMVACASDLTRALVPAWLLFAGLCSLNCISIAVWERELDRAQGRISIATEFSSIARLLPWLLAMLALGSGVLAVMGGAPFRLCLSIALSALLLGALHFSARILSPDTRTALADIVLLTPLVYYFVA